MGKKKKIECPDCKGSGLYKGLLVVEDCLRCEGTGTVCAPSRQAPKDSGEEDEPDTLEMFPSGSQLTIWIS